MYGDSLIESNHHIIVTGWNDSVVDKIKEDQIHEIEYNDFGETKGIHSEIGYNGEMQDSNGLIYLRARYYDSSIGRFIQIDNHYEGEQSNVASQNRYAYTLNNPYKYVDRDGNKAKKKKKNYLTMSDKEFKKYIKDKPLLIKLTMTTARTAYQAMRKVYSNVKTLTGNGRNVVLKVKNAVNKVKEKIDIPKLQCNIRETKLYAETPEGQEIIQLCENLYQKYAKKFDDSGRLSAIRSVINEVRNTGLNNKDVEYVRKKCKEYEKKMRLPKYTTSDGVSYLTESYVSLENSIISDAFVSDVSHIGEYQFTLNITEKYLNSSGIRMTLVQFTASFFDIDEECINFKLSLVLDFASVSFVYYVNDYIYAEVGVFIGMGGEIGFSYSISLSELELITKNAIFFGAWIKIGINILDIIM